MKRVPGTPVTAAALAMTLALAIAPPARAEGLREALAGKVLVFPGPDRNEDETLVFSLNPDGTGIGQEVREGRPRPEPITWRIEGARLCIDSAPGGMSATGGEECIDVTLRGDSIRLGSADSDLKGYITPQKK